MLDKIKEVLGEELAKAIDEKLTEAKIELAIMNDGSVVKSDKYETLKTEYKGLETKYQSDIGDVNSKLKEAMDKATDYDGLKGTLETMKTENAKTIDEYKASTERIKKTSAIDVALLKANVKDGYTSMLKSQIDVDKLSFDGDTLVGLNDTIEKFKTTYVDLFGTLKKTGGEPDTGKPSITTERSRLIEQYNTAEKNKDAKQMMALTAKIKTMKE